MAAAKIRRAQKLGRALTELSAWDAMAKGSYASNTLRAWKADWNLFLSFCAVHQLQSLPAVPHTVRAFVFDCLRQDKKPATIRRYIATIGRAHRSAKLNDPTRKEAVRLALKEMGRTVPSRQRQARALTWGEIAKFLEFEPRNLREHRDRALVAVAYDTLCRRQELVSLRVDDIDYANDGSATILIRRSKTDTEGQGATAYLAPLTVKLLATWLQEARVTAGPLFLRVSGTKTVAEMLTAQVVTAIFRKVGLWIGLAERDVMSLSGHSTRVGAAQDLIALNIDLASVMQSGRWKDSRMPMRYAERVLATRGGMARAAKAQGRG
jgi:site-specific recombinase XerD